MSKHPGQVITNYMLASMVSEAWPQALTPLNIMSGFKKTGIYPLNPGEIHDRQMAPSKAVTPQPEHCITESPPFTEEQLALFEKQYKEGYDLENPEYKVWLKITHPCSINSAASIASKSSASYISEELSETSQQSDDVLSNILVLPEPKLQSSKRSKHALNQKAVCITEGDVLGEMKKREEDKLAEEAAKAQRKVDRELRQQQKKRENEEKKKEREQKRLEREIEKEKKKMEMEQKKMEREKWSRKK